MKSFRFIYLRLLTLLFMSVCINAAIAPTARGALTLTPVLQGLSSPVYVTNAHDGSNRLFVVEQAGRIKVLAPGAIEPAVFLDIVAKVKSGGEQGLLGLAFHPQFATNTRFFVNYTRQPDGATVIAEYRASADPAVTAASEIVLLVVAQPAANHNGGMIEFGNDGFLYIGMGDGGSSNDPSNRAQNVNDLLGKILRIDIDHPAGGNAYSSPAGNPYMGATPGRDEIFALGVRNPFRFSFDRQTGQLYVGDVGQSALEEVDVVTAGGNYGWRVYEGNTCTGLDPGLCNPANFVPPIAQYDHSGGRCSVTGGYVYRGTAATLPLGTYVFGDFCSGTIYSLVSGTPNLLLDTSLNISSFGEDESREIYVVGLGGTVHRLATTGATPGSAAATFLGSDLLTQGNWKGTYGSEGYAVFGDTTNYPAYAQVTPSGKTDYVWAAQPNADPRALQRGVAAGRIAACWYSSSVINIDLNLTDGANHKVTLYLLDWETTIRSTRVEVLDANTQQVLATQNVSSFHNGVHLKWDLRGHVIVRLTNTSNFNTVISGIFFDASGVAPPAPTSTVVASSANPAALGSPVTFTATVSGTNPTGDVSFTAGGNPLAGCNPVALTGTSTAACATADLGLGAHTIVASYLGDAANLASASPSLTQNINAPGSAAATFLGSDLLTQGNWKGTYGSEGYAVFGDTTNYPAYAQVTPSGKTDYVWAAQPNADPRALQRGVAAGRIAACWYSSSVINIDLNLTDGANHKVTLYLLDWETTIRSTRVEVLDANTQQVLATQNVSSFQNGVHLKWDLRGHVIVRLTNTSNFNTVISGIFFDASGVAPPAPTSTVVASSANPAALGSPVTFTATVSGANPTGNVSFTDGGNPLAGCNPVALTGFGNARTAACATADLGLGAHTIVASYLGDAANLASASPSLTQNINAPGSAAATFLGSDLLTQGNWKGTYGSEGYAVFGDTTNYPAYAQVTPSGKTDYVWAAQPNADPRALQRGVAAGRIAACWYSSSVINIDLNLTDGANHKVTLYLLDWETTIRSTRVEVLDANTQQVLATQNVSSFHNGVHLKWDLRGHVIVRLTNTSNFNTVISGIFFDASGVAPPSGSSNVALAANGAVATASSTIPGRSPVSLNDNERAGINWSTAGFGGVWRDGTADVFPDWVQINFNGSQTIDRVVVYSPQDNYTSPVEPTDSMTFAVYGVRDYTIQGWDGSAWVTLASIAGNNLIKRVSTFAPFTTDRIRVNITFGLSSYSRLAEIEAWGGAAGTPASTAWSTFGRDAQHTALSTTASQPLNQIRWQTPVDLQPQYTGNGSLLVHYGSPVITAANTVIVPVKTGATSGFRVEARAGSNGALQWTMTTDYILPSHNWVPAYGPALTSQSRLYFPGAGGTVYFRDQVDATVGTSGQIAFYGLANYQANPQAYNASVIINTPLTTDPSGNIYFGFLVTGSTPLGLTSGIARISASGQGSWTPVTTASADANMTKVPHNSAPALSGDHRTLYVAVSNGSSGYLVALDSTTLAPVARVPLTDPKSGQSALLSDNGSASPTVGTDGDIYFGVLETPFGSNHRRGWLLHFNGSLSQSKTPGAFGWDTTVGLVPASMVPSYQGTSAYLLMTKYNHYLGLGGDGMNKIAILDPNTTQTDPVTGTTVMKEVLTMLGPTPDPAGGVKEWCINTAAVDPFTKSILANNEDGKLYRWDLTTNTLSQTVVLTAGLGEAYTSTVVGPDGKVYATNNAILFAVGQ